MKVAPDNRPESHRRKLSRKVNPINSPPLSRHHCDRYSESFLLFFFYQSISSVLPVWPWNLRRMRQLCYARDCTRAAAQGLRGGLCLRTVRHAKETKKLNSDRLWKIDPVPDNRAGIGGRPGPLSKRRGRPGKFDRLKGDAPGLWQVNHLDCAFSTICRPNTANLRDEWTWRWVIG